MFLVMGVAAILGFHVLVNVAMVIGFMPVTGIPLPLMSYGGSAMLFVFLALGLVMNVRLGRFVGLLALRANDPHEPLGHDGAHAAGDEERLNTNID